MLLFDWKKVYDTAEGNIARCNLIMEMLVNQHIPRNKFDPIYKYSHKNFVGTSFLAHGEFLLHNSYKYTNKELCIYYALASLAGWAVFDDTYVSSHIYENFPFVAESSLSQHRAIGKPFRLEAVKRLL